ncbi:MAG: hypothetical protein KFF50_13505 [Desulfatitalea sp.]|nr:hypothetical protein [Desulfatitalea sp.]
MGLTAAIPAFHFLTRSPLIRRGAELARRLVRRSASVPPDTCLPAFPPAGLPNGAPPEACDGQAMALSPPPLVDTDALSADLLGSGKALTVICARTEDDFLDLGGRLHTIQAEAQQLTQTIVAALAEDQTDSIQGALKTIERHAAGAIEEINARRQQLAEDLRGLQTIRVDLGALDQQNQQFKQVAKNLKMVGLTIRIESARSPAASAAFQALAEEIAELARTVHTAVRHISADAHTARQTLDAVQADIGARMADLETLMGDAQAAVLSALDQVAHFMALTMDALDRIGEQSRQIDQQVGHLVVSVQIHDNISQRAAHIQEAMDEAVHILAAIAEVPLPAVLGRVYGINRVQVAQLQTITEDVDGVRRQSESALDSLLAAVAAVTRAEALDTLEIGGACPAGNARGRHPVALLTRELERLIALFDEGLSHIRRLGEAREQTGRTMDRMNAHIDQVRDINFEIRLKALNAVIRSSRLGDAGRAIAAIVNEMKALAEQSNTTIGAVTDIMERIAASSRAMDRANADATDVSGGAGALLRQGIETFATACADFKTNSHQAIEMGRQLEARIGESRDRIHFFDTMGQGCQDQLARLAAVKTTLQPFADAAPDDWMAEEQRVMARYTMDRERKAHLGIIQTGQPQAPDPCDPGAAADDDAFDDNVELF